MTENSNPLAPKHLSKESKALWNKVVEDYTLEAHALHLLRLACESLDEAEEARLLLKKEGLTVATMHGVKTHPAVAIRQRAKMAYISHLRALGINETKEEKRPVGRPPAY